MNVVAEITELWVENYQKINCRDVTSILEGRVIITEISNKTTNKLTIYAILCRINVTTCYRQELAYLFQVQGKLRECRN